MKLTKSQYFEKDHKIDKLLAIAVERKNDTNQYN